MDLDELEIYLKSKSFGFKNHNNPKENLTNNNLQSYYTQIKNDANLQPKRSYDSAQTNDVLEPFSKS